MEKQVVETAPKPLAAMRLAERGISQGVAITKRGMILSGPALVIASAVFGPILAALEAGGSSSRRR